MLERMIRARERTREEEKRRQDAASVEQWRREQETSTFWQEVRARDAREAKQRARIAEVRRETGLDDFLGQLQNVAGERGGGSITTYAPNADAEEITFHVEGSGDREGDKSFKIVVGHGGEIAVAGRKVEVTGPHGGERLAEALADAYENPYVYLRGPSSPGEGP